MKPGQRLWTRDELILAINLNCKLPFGRLHRGNPQVKRLAAFIGRTDSAVSYKPVNFASLDPSLQARGIKGAPNISNRDREVWQEIYLNWDQLAYESEKLLAAFEHTTVERLNQISEDELPKAGLTRERLVKVRVNQAFFRSTVLAAYNNTCCITGIRQPELLIAGHIKPWGLDEDNRLNPRNGLAINALHDKAFESGLLTITPDLVIKPSSLLLEKRDDNSKAMFAKFHGKPIYPPSRFLPDRQFLEYHNKERFRN